MSEIEVNTDILEQVDSELQTTSYDLGVMSEMGVNTEEQKDDQKLKKRGKEN